MESADRVLGEVTISANGKLRRVGRRLGRRAARNTDTEALVSALDEVAKLEVRDELVEARRALRIKRRREKRCKKRVAELLACVPENRVCPGCKRVKKRTNQWTKLEVDGVVVAFCVGCGRMIRGAMKK